MLEMTYPNFKKVILSILLDDYTGMFSEVKREKIFAVHKKTLVFLYFWACSYGIGGLRRVYFALSWRKDN